jgi:predicted glycoside hydrolase/deacetylase ChbG (UPF0249 family)
MKEAAGSARLLTLCADDFGMNDSIDDGILALARQGRVHAVSLLTQGPSVARRAADLRGLDVDLGLHLNFTEALGCMGIFMNIGPLVARSYAGRLDAQALNAQIERQLDKFETHCGRAPDYVDGHQHVHQLPQIREALLACLSRRYDGHRPWVRITTPGDLHATPWRARAKAQAISMLGSTAFADAAARAGLRRNRRFLGVYDLSGGVHAYAMLMQGWLDGAQNGDLMMCHPAASVAGDGVLARQRLAEFQVIASAAMADWLAQRGLRLGRLADA